VSPGHRPVTVRITQDQPCCPRCGAAGLLTAGVPHGWVNPDGTATSGVIPVVLCASCDANEPGAAPLITYFHVHGQVDAASVAECAALIQGWADSLTVAPLDQVQLEEEIRAWQRGDL
jgi:hypothetical protein